MNYKKLVSNLLYIKKIITPIPITLYGVIHNKDSSITIYEITTIKGEFDFIDFSMGILERYSREPLYSKKLVNITYNEVILLCIFGLYGNINDRNLHLVSENIKNGFPTNNPFQFNLYYTCNENNFDIKVL